VTLYSTTLATPIGPFTMLAGDDGVHAADFTGCAEDLRPRLDHEHRASGIRAAADLAEYSRAVAAYFSGDLAAIDGIPVVQHGTPYLLAAWRALREIPAGTSITYRELATRLGNAAAARAAGSACGRNTVALIVPCHRVLRSGGALGGYASGLPHKRWLLAHEAQGG